MVSPPKTGYLAWGTEQRPPHSGMAEVRAMSLFHLAVLILSACPILAGCGGDPNQIGRFETVWARRGISDGRFQKPRAITIDAQDHIYIVDMTARIQAFDRDGNFLTSWRTPAKKNGKPTGLGIGRDGSVLVADTHYSRVLVYSPTGELRQTIGGTFGHRPGELAQVTDVAQDSQGNYYVGEKGEYDRIQKFSPQGDFLLEWGGHGTEPGQFVLPQSLAVDEDDNLWVADACNHRIQVFDPQGKLLRIWGSQGHGLGELDYPYDLVLADDGTVYVCEYGNHRIQRFTREGKSLGTWGRPGRQEGELFNPWGLVMDSQACLHVLDTGNHRVQRVRM